MATVINININGQGVSQSVKQSKPVESDPYRDFPLLPGFTRVRELDGFRKLKAKKKKNCSNGQVCGFSCISKSKTCIANMTTAQLKEHNAAKRAQKKAATGGGATPTTQKTGTSVTPEQLDELYSRNNWWAGTKKQIEKRLASGVYAINEEGKLYKVDDTKIANPLNVEAPTKETVKSSKFSQREKDAYNKVESLQDKMKTIKVKSGQVEIRSGDGERKEIVPGTQYGDSGIWVIKSTTGKYNVTHEGTGLAVIGETSKKNAVDLARFLASTGDDLKFDYVAAKQIQTVVTQSGVDIINRPPQMITLYANYGDWLMHKRMKTKGDDPNLED